MQPPRCLNCHTTLIPNQKFCPECGQKANTQRITMKYLLKDFVYVFTHADRGIFNLLRGLAANPGKTAREYVEGKRKAYFNPFAFLALCIGFSVFANHWLHPYPDLPAPDPDVLMRIPGDQLRQQYLLSVDRMATMQNFFNRNMNILLVVITPYFAFFLWIFFRYRNRNAAEINVAYLLFTGFSNVASVFLFYPLLALVKNTSAYYYVFFGMTFLQTLYFTWGLKTFFNYRTTTGYFNVLGILLLIGLIGFVILFAGLFIYVYGGGASKVLRYL